MNLYLNADCMNPETGLPSYPDKFFKLAILDPPYGIKRLTSGGMPKAHGFKNWDRKLWDNNVPDSAYWQEVKRVSVNQIVWGGNYFTDHLPTSQGWIFWFKQKGMTFADGELAWTSFDVATRIFDEVGMGGNGRIHPTQKDVRLYRWILKNYAKAGDNILDTHVGSASSLIAFEEMGFEYVGYELDKDYYRDSCKRLEAFRAQPKLFSGGEIFEASKQPIQGSLF